MMKIFFTILLATSSLLLAAQNPVVSNLTDQFNASGGVKIGPDGFLYVADFGAELQNANGNQVWRINRSTGEKTVFATGLQGASGNDFDSEGNLFQSNIAGNWIAKISPQGAVSNFTNVGISSPVGIAIDASDNLYVANCGDNTIRKITSNGNSTLFASGNIFSCPNGITLDHEENIYVSNFGGSNNVVKITPEGITSVLANIPGNNNGHLTFYAPDTVLFVNSHGSSSIYRVTLDGVVTKIAGTGARGNVNGTALGQATFSRPNGIAISPDGDTLWLNSSIPTQDNPTANFYPLNPSIVRIVNGLKFMISSSQTQYESFDNLILSPNPVSDELIISFDRILEDDLSLRIMDGLGQEVLKKQLTKNDATGFKDKIVVQDLVDGIYYLVIHSDNYAVTKSFMKL